MQQGGSQYGVSPDMTSSFAGTRVLDPLQQQQLMQQQKPGDAALAEAASPISSRPPARGNFDELGSVPGGFPDEDALAGEETERGLTGNRWPRQETVALLKIRSDMDAAFRDATLKGPLWEDVSRKLAEQGYSRSAKKCKEKFENVQKYYKRTKEGRAGRQDGRSYRFFSQLEALHSSTTPAPTTAAPIPPATSNPMVGSSSTRIQPPPASATTSAPTQIGIQRIGPDLTVEPTAPGISGPAPAPAPAAPTVGGISFSSNTSSESGSESEEEMEEGPSTGSRKRKRSESSGGSRKMMAFFEGLMRQVMEKQEAMQQRFLEAMEKREQDRMIREEAWKRQEMARLAREHEILAQERAMAASRDAAIIAFLQKLTGQTIQIPQLVAIPTMPVPPQPQPHPQPKANPPPPPPPAPVPQQQIQQSQNTEKFRHQPSSTELVLVQQEQQLETGGSFDPVSSSRWPKSEVLELIQLRSGLESRYQEAGPKGPLWEEISAGMQRRGYNRSAKRCKEKWENINKYFKKVKESNKKRPEDAKTCPYFHQLDALYKKKILGGGSSSTSTLSTHNKQEQDVSPNPQERTDILAIMPPPPPPPPSQPQAETETKSSSTSNKNGGNTEGGSSLQVQTSNGGFPPSFFEEGPLKKPEDIVKELMDQQQAAMDNYKDSDNLNQEEDDGDDDGDEDEDENDDDDDEDDKKMAFKIQFQSKNSSNGGNPSSSFLAMVQ